MLLMAKQPYRGGCGRQSPRGGRPQAQKKASRARLLAFIAEGGGGYPCPDWLLNTLHKCGHRWLLSFDRGGGAAEAAATRVEGSARRTCAALVAELAQPDLPTLLQIVKISRASPHNLYQHVEQSLVLGGIKQPFDSTHDRNLDN